MKHDSLQLPMHELPQRLSQMSHQLRLHEGRRVEDSIEQPNVRAKLSAEAGAVSPVRDDAPCAADRAYSACRSGSA
jgi:hypothetical protein